MISAQDEKIKKLMLNEFLKDKPETPLLDKIQAPIDFRNFSIKELQELAKEIRLFLTWSIAQSGGHFASSLGCVELTIALHFVFDTPKDKIIWDVGHQAYAHKMLTGRLAAMPSIRSFGGLAPFPAMEESEYDAFGVGHSSTSIGAALGMALAFRNLKQDTNSIAIIGDGALTAGMAFEALENAGNEKANLLVILNDNDMSISANVGGMSNYLSNIMLSDIYSQFRSDSRKILSHLPFAWQLAKKTEEHIKGLVNPGHLFEEMGFEYLGPFDGHNLEQLIEILQDLKKINKPIFLHLRTQKGKGFLAAEKDPIKYHGLGKFKVGEAEKTKTSAIANSLSYANVFGKWICDVAQKDNLLHAITPAMREGSDLIEFSQKFPERYFDVAIAEQHALTFAAGLACGGVKPVVAIYSSFLQRAYDQLIHDLAIQKLDVVLAVDRGGIVGEDGATHQGIFDLSFMRPIPNLIIMTPSDENELYKMLNTAYKTKGLVAVRYPRGVGRGEPLEKSTEVFAIGKAKIKRHGQKIAILAFGDILRASESVAENINATLVDMRFVKPLDEELILELAKTHEFLVTLEEGVIAGGAGAGVLEFLNQAKIAENLENAKSLKNLENLESLGSLKNLDKSKQARISTKILNLGIGDTFVEHGDKTSLMQMLNLDSKGIESSIKAFTEKT